MNRSSSSTMAVVSKELTQKHTRQPQQDLWCS
jgi:hypothetical protein